MDELKDVNLLSEDFLNSSTEQEEQLRIIIRLLFSVIDEIKKIYSEIETLKNNQGG